MTQKLLCALLSFSAIIGCTRKTLYGPASESFEVRFQATGLEISASDAQDRTKGVLPGGTALNIAVYQGSEFILQKPYTVTTEGVMTPEDGTVLELEAGDYDFYAYGPDLELNTEDKEIEEITHGVDLIAARAVDQSITGAGKDISLTFNHLMSKVSFGIEGSDDEGAVVVTSLDATKLTLAEMATSPATYTLGSSITPTRGIGEENTYIIDDFEQAEDGKSTFGEGIVLPKANGTFGLVVNVFLNGSALELAAVVPSIAFQAGKHYAFTAEVMERVIRLKLTVLDWTNAKYIEDGTGDVMVVGSWELLSSGEPDLGHGVNTGFTVGAWTAAKYAEDGTGQMMTVKEWEHSHWAETNLGN